MDSRADDRLWAEFDRVEPLDAEERRAALEHLRSADAELARELERLLDTPAGFLAPLRGELRADAEGPDPASPPEPRDGVLVAGRYALGELVGAGSMGAVHRGRRVDFEKPVAIKLLHAERGTSEETLARALEEASAASRVRHPAVVGVHDVGVHEGRAYLVMDWVDGVDLQRWLAYAEREGCFAEGTPALAAFVEAEMGEPVSGPLWTRPYCEVVAHLVAQTARALAEAHSRGLVHRDVAPKNILVRPDGTPCLVDFGVASLCEGTRSSESGAAGTLVYMAPEQLDEGTAARSPSVDVYSLGATLYHLLAGRLPFESSGVALCAAIVNKLPPPLRECGVPVPRDLDAVCFGAMEKSPARRYGSAAELADDLEAFLDRRPVSRRWPTPFGRAVRLCQRRPAVAVAGVALAALLVVSVVAGFLGLGELARQRAADARDELAGLVAALPAAATLETDARYATGPHPSATDAELGPVWARIVALAPDEPLFGWYRANWCSQHDDTIGAGRELARLRGRGHGSVVLDVLADALTASDPIARNRLVEPAALPAAESAFDHALRGYVAARWRDFMTAWVELSAAIELDDRWTYRDLRALVGLELDAADLPVQDAARVEAELGRETCRTLHVRAYLLHERSPFDAHALWSAALDVRPGQHQPLHGLGRLELRAGRLDEAERLLREAVEVKPGSWRSFVLLSRCAEGRAAFDEALRRLDEGEDNLLDGRPAGSFAPENDLLIERASVLAAWAIHLSARGDVAKAREQFARAEDAASEAVRAASPGLAFELAAMRASIAFDAGELSAGDAEARIRAAQLGHVREAHADSPAILGNLGLLLLRQPERRTEAEVALELARADPVLRGALAAAVAVIEED